MASSTAEIELREGATVDRYIVHRRLGAGKGGVVYQVSHRGLGSVHALKILVAATRDTRDRLQREGVSQAVLRHPNIVKVTDLIDLAGAPAIVSEYVSGPTLEEITETGPLPNDEALMLLRDIAAALAHAHDMGVPHGALSKRNVIIADVGSRLEARVTDFDIARQLNGTKPNRACDDVYAWGKLACDMVGGGPDAERPPPSINHTVWSLMQACASEDPDRRPDLIAVVMEMDEVQQDTWSTSSIARTTFGITAPPPRARGKVVAAMLVGFFSSAVLVGAVVASAYSWLG